MNIDILRAKRDFWERALSSLDQMSIGNFLDETFHGMLKEHIYQLHSRHHQRDYENFDNDYLLHEEIVRLFNNVNVDCFSLNELCQFRTWEDTLLLGMRLERQKLIEADTNREIRLLEDHIQGVKPLINPEKVDLYLNRNLPVKVGNVEEITYLIDIADENEVYQNFFSAVIIKNDIGERLAGIVKGREELEAGYVPLELHQSRGLGSFKQDRHPKYSSSNYAAVFVNWRLREFRRIVNGG